MPDEIENDVTDENDADPDYNPRIAALRASGIIVGQASDCFKRDNRYTLWCRAHGFRLRRGMPAPTYEHRTGGVVRCVGLPYDTPWVYEPRIDPKLSINPDRGIGDTPEGAIRDALNSMNEIARDAKTSAGRLAKLLGGTLDTLDTDVKL